MAQKNKGINIFRHVPKADLPRTLFNMNHYVKFDGDFGAAYPFLFQDVIAGDTWSVACDHFARLAPMVAPVLHEFDVRFHFFFVPTRLLWDDYEDWLTGGSKGTWREENPDAFPTFNLEDAITNVLDNDSGSDAFLGSIFDFMGLNFMTDAGNETQISYEDLIDSKWKFSALPLRAYWMIWNYFFRDQNVMEEMEIPTTSGPDDMSWLTDNEYYAYLVDKGLKDGLFRVAWDKDYFTSATLSPQRGPQVYIPLGATAPLMNVNPVTVGSLSPQQGTRVQVGNGSSSAGSGLDLTVVQTSGAQVLGSQGSSGTFVTDLSKGMVADLSAAQGAPVDDVREAFALQRFFERMQIVGSRMQEFLRGVFGTNPGDARLQMPEYLGSWQNPFLINNISNTSGAVENKPQGSYAGNGLAAKFNTPIVKNFQEPGYIIGLYVAMPRNGYQQGLSKLLTRLDWLDHFNPYFEHIGEQPILTSELYFDPSVNPNQDPIFGYQGQYASYKFINSHSHGQFKKSLDFWHANRQFSDTPTLSSDFIAYDKDESTDRVFVLPNEPKFYVELDMKVDVTRPMTAFSTPKLI